MNPEPYKDRRLVNITFPLKDSNSGKDLWERLVRLNKIELVLCGHIFGRGYQCDKNNEVRKCIKCFFDTQNERKNGGNGIG